MTQTILSIFTLCLFLTQTLASEDVIKSVRYLKPEASFSEVSDLYLKDGIITRIIPSKHNDQVRYVIPSFCDAYITLGVDGAGGQNNLQTIQTSLRSFLYHGVTHVLSIADGPWIHKIKSEIDSGKLLGPKITIASRPLIPKSSEVKDISDVLYFPVENPTSAFSELERQLTEISRSVHIFNRYTQDANFSFDSGLLNQLRLEAKDKNKLITVHTFGDRISILDALISGNRYLVHPILYEMETEITRQHKEEINLIPILNVYRNSYLNNLEGSEGLTELEMLKKKDKFFLDHYVSLYEGSLGFELDSKEIETRQLDYLSYTKFIEKNPILKQKLILGSGAGNRLSFPGVSFIQELQILGKILKNDENLFRIPTQNSCSYIGGSYNGVLAVGKEANLIVLKDNPAKNINTLFEIEQVFQFGKLVRFNSTTTKKIRKKK
ncbi:MAG: hypothetical protein KBA66_13270 [Leptospiraceae bacterium]|nr:hypothetical protein [Leptospiraceae bacterium]